MASVFAYQPIPAKDPQAIVCTGLSIVGVSCAPAKAYVPHNYNAVPNSFNFDIFSNTPVSSTGSSTAADANGNSNSNLTATISNSIAPKNLSGQKINLVSVPKSGDIYELVNGQKHLIPSLAIFYDYGYKLDMVQSISQAQLDKYPRADLVKVQGSSSVYYLTQGGLVRQVVDTKKIFEFYGDRTEDIITISRKEFNFYPSNQYVYQESPLNRDVFQITGKNKRYLTPMAVARLGVTIDQVAPVTKAELDYYKTLAPLID